MKNYIRLYKLIDTCLLDPENVFYSIDVKYPVSHMYVGVRYSGYGRGNDFNEFMLSRGSAKVKRAVITCVDDNINMRIEAIGEVIDL